MKNYYVTINFECNEIGLNSKRNFSVKHIFYNQPDEVDDDLKNYWLNCVMKLLHNLYNNEDFKPILDKNRFDIYAIPDGKNIIVDRKHRILQEKENRKYLEFRAKMFKQENDFVSINEDLIRMRRNIPGFNLIDSFFNNVKF